MTTAQLIDTATKQIKSRAGYNYTPSVVDDVCAAGWDGVEDGTIVAENSEQTARIDKAHNVLSVCDFGGTETAAHPLTDEMKNKTIVVVAIRKSRNSSIMGSM